ncbi:hypothetical protein HDV03_002839 [Kappamyces sp. JEL0829]|nr:hypothetical protein HDV03_002839 [Kappamyces sp. JEL0829]
MQMELVAPRHLAYDRPSPKFLSFLKKFYGLEEFQEQPNHFVVFKEFGLRYLELDHKPTPPTSVTESLPSELPNVFPKQEREPVQLATPPSEAAEQERRIEMKCHVVIPHIASASVSVSSDELFHSAEPTKHSFSSSSNIIDPLTAAIDWSTPPSASRFAPDRYPLQRSGGDPLEVERQSRVVSLIAEGQRNRLPSIKLNYEPLAFPYQHPAGIKSGSESRRRQLHPLLDHSHLENLALKTSKAPTTLNMRRYR